MPDDLNGNHSLTVGYKAVTGQNVLVSNHNPPLEDLSSCMTARLPRNGSAPMLAALPMGAFKITGLADGTAATDAATIAQAQSAGGRLSFPLASGTADALTITPTVPFIAYTAGDVLTFTALGDNTGPATVNVSSVGVKAIRKIVVGADVALAAKDMLAAGRYELTYDAAANAAAGAWILINPSLQSALDNRVRFDAAQTLTDTEKAQARKNIGMENGYPLLYVRDEKPSGTSGGASSAGVAINRVLNTVVVNEIGGSSLASNLVTLPAGTYRIRARAPAYLGNRQRISVQSAAGTMLLLGSSEYCSSSDNGHTNSTIDGRLVLAVSTQIKLCHYIQTAHAQGLGVDPSDAPNVAIFGEMWVEKLK